MSSGRMSNPWAPQRRTPLAVAFEPIPLRMARRFPPRTATGDALPIRGQFQLLPDGRPGGVPIDPPTPLMAPLAKSPMPMQSAVVAAKARKEAQREIRAKRFIAKPLITLLQTSKPQALDAAKSLRYKPAVADKPETPAGFVGGAFRVQARNVEFPKDTSVSMKPTPKLFGRVF